MTEEERQAARFVMRKDDGAYRRMALDMLIKVSNEIYDQYKYGDCFIQVNPELWKTK